MIHIKKGDIVPFYLNPMNPKEEEFEGYGRVLDTPEPYETFLVGKAFYQLFRVNVRFLMYNELSEFHTKHGRLNDRFLTKAFITHKKVRVLISEDADDVMISDLTYAPKKHEKAIVKSWQSDEESSRWRETYKIELYHSHRPKANRGRWTSNSTSKERG